LQESQSQSFAVASFLGYHTFGEGFLPAGRKLVKIKTLASQCHTIYEHPQYEMWLKHLGFNPISFWGYTFCVARAQPV
jgi:hypothetical protein